MKEAGVWIGLEHNTVWLTLLCTDNKTIKHTYISVFIGHMMHEHCSKYKTYDLTVCCGCFGGKTETALSYLKVI